MLKRRAISPPPGSAIPLVSDPPDSYRRESKRRRILPPSLDGQSRRSILPAEDDDGEEEDEDDVHLSNGRNPFGPGPSASPVHNTEYESANTFLHDLHALHRHRLIFSSSSPPFLQPELPAAPHTQDKSYFSPILDFARTPDKQEPSGMHDIGCGVGEVQSVKERYEDTNKLRPSLFFEEVDFILCRLLGSLFLTRRKQLDPHQYNNT